MDKDAGLPLHEEAKARRQWRGGETILDKKGRGNSGPASEIDDAAQGGDDSGAPPVENPIAGPPD